jgi:hypothetical protein
MAGEARGSFSFSKLSLFCEFAIAVTASFWYFIDEPLFKLG